MTNDQAISAFFKRILPMNGIYKRCRVTCLAIELDSRLRNISTEVLFDINDETLSIPQELARLPHPLRVFRSSVLCGNAEMTKLFDELSKGSLDFRGQEVCLHGFVQDSFHPMNVCFNYSDKGCREPHLNVKLDCSFELLESFGGEELYSLIPELESLNRQLQSSSPPFVDLADIGRELFVDHSRLTGHHMSRVSVIAPWHARLDAGTWNESGELEIGIKASHEFAPSVIDLGFMATEPSGKIGRGRSTVTRVNTTSSEFIYVAQVPVGQADEVTAMLGVGGKTIEKATYCRPVPGIRLLQYFSESMAAIKDYLATSMSITSPASKRGKTSIYMNKFEVGVMFLLQLCQWECQPYGMIEGHDVPDGVALNHKTGQAIVYECSSEAPHYKEKSYKLFRRAQDLKKQLPQYQFMPIMFTALPRPDVPAIALKAAEEEGVLVICQDDIQEWLSRLEAGMPVDILA